MTNSCQRLPTPWSEATDATASCRRPSTGYGPKPPSGAGWLWISNGSNKPSHARKRSPAFTKHEYDPKRQLPCYSVALVLYIEDMAVAKFSGGKDLQGYSVGIDDLALARDFQKFAVG